MSISDTSLLRQQIDSLRRALDQERRDRLVAHERHEAAIAKLARRIADLEGAAGEQPARRVAA